MYAKYEVSISYGSKVMAKVKVFCHRVKDRQTGQKLYRCPRIPFQGHKNLDHFNNVSLNKCREKVLPLSKSWLQNAENSSLIYFLKDWICNLILWYTVYCSLHFTSQILSWWNIKEKGRGAPQGTKSRQLFGAQKWKTGSFLLPLIEVSRYHWIERDPTKY